jgi:hypothetical protein
MTLLVVGKASSCESSLKVNDEILSSPEFELKSTTHDKSSCWGTWKGQPILLLGRVEDFAQACNNEEVAPSFFTKLGSALSVC